MLSSIILTILFIIIVILPLPLLIVEIILFCKAKGDEAKRKKLKIVQAKCYESSKVGRYRFKKK